MDDSNSEIIHDNDYVPSTLSGGSNQKSCDPNKPTLLSILMKNTDLSIQEIRTKSKQMVSSSNWIKSSTEGKEALHHLSESNDLEPTIQTLLTYFKKETNNKNQNPISSKHDTLSIPYIRSTLRCVILICEHPSQLPTSKIAMDLIQTLSNCICKRIKLSIEKDQNDLIHSSLIACHDLLHNIHPLITNSGKAFLLPSMWRSLCDILHHLSLYCNQQSLSVFQTIFNHSLSILIQCLEDGEINLKKQIVQIMQTTSIPNNGMRLWTFQSQMEIQKRISHQQHQQKLTTFLLARLGSLFSSFMNASISNDIDTFIWKKALRCLAKLRGIGESGNIIMEYYQSNIETNISKDQQRLSMQLKQVQINLCTHACQIGQKVDQTIWKILFRSQFSNQSQSYTQNHSSIYHSILRLLHTIENENENQMLRSIPSMATTHMDINPLSIMLLGKLLLQFHILTKLSQMEIFYTNQNTIHPFENDLLHLCQTILHSSLPQCHAMLTFHIDSNDTKTSSRILADIIHLLVDCSLRYTKCTKCKEKSQKMIIHTHQWFAKWLAPISNDHCMPLHKQSISIHPLTREIILSTICIHFSYLWHFNKQNPSNMSHVSMVYFISFFTKLLLDPRTTCIHAKNISTALHRTSLCTSIDQTSTTFTKHDFFSIVWKTFLLYKHSNKSSNKSRKQMGKFNIAALNTITLVLEMIPSEIIWSDENTAKTIREFCSLYIQDHSYVGKNKGSSSLLFMFTYLNATIMNNPYQQLSNNNEGNRIRIEKYFFEKTGIPLNHYYNVQLRRIKTEIDYSSISCHIYESILRFTHFMTVLYGSSHVKKLDDFLALSVKQYDTFIKNRNVIDCANIAFRHCMENAMILGKIGVLITKNCPRKSLEVLVDLFNLFLNSHLWPLVTVTMSSLETFSTNLLSDHQWMIMKILPKNYHDLFKCRLTGNAWNGMEQTNFEDKHKKSMQQLAFGEQVILYRVYGISGEISNQISINPSTPNAHNLKSPVLILPPNVTFRKEDWFAMGEKLGFCQGTKGNEINASVWSEVSGFKLKEGAGKYSLMFL